MTGSIADQRRMLTTAALLTFTVGVLAGFKRDEGLPTARFIVGVSLAMTLCSAMVDLGMPVGAGFAVLIMVSALFYNGEDAFALLSDRQRQRGRRRRRRGRVPEPLDEPDTEEIDFSETFNAWQNIARGWVNALR